MIQSTEHRDYEPQRVSDDVWSELGPVRPPTRRLAAIVAALVLVAAALLLGARSGAVVPRLSVELSGVTVHNLGGQEFMLELTVKNEGWSTVRIESVAESLPGLSLDRVLVAPQNECEDMSCADLTHVPSLPFSTFSLGPNQRRNVRVEYAMTDCAKMPRGQRRLPVKADALVAWTTRHVIPPQKKPGRDLTTYEWQHLFALQTCSPQSFPPLTPPTTAPVSAVPAVPAG